LRTDGKKELTDGKQEQAVLLTVEAVNLFVFWGYLYY
jgi:hypothetical protein